MKRLLFNFQEVIRVLSAILKGLPSQPFVPNVESSGPPWLTQSCYFNSWANCSGSSQQGTFMNPAIIFVNLLRGVPDYPQTFLKCWPGQTLPTAIIAQRDCSLSPRSVIEDHTHIFARGELVFRISLPLSCGTALVCAISNQLICIMQREQRWALESTPCASSWQWSFCAPLLGQF